MSNYYQKMLARTTTTFKRIKFQALTEQFTAQELQQVPRKHFFKVLDKLNPYLPSWFLQYGFTIGGILAIGSFLLAILAAFLQIMIGNTTLTWLLITRGVPLGLVLMLLPGSIDYESYRLQKRADSFLHDNANLDIRYQPDYVGRFDANKANDMMMPTIPEYRWGSMAANFSSNARLLVNHQFEAGTWHYHDSGADSILSYGIYDMHTKLPTVRFRLRHPGSQHFHLIVEDLTDEPLHEVRLKAGFDTKIKTTLQRKSDKKLVVNLFTDDVLATIHDLFAKHTNLLEVECDGSQMVTLWHDEFDSLGDETPHNTEALYQEIFSVTQAIVKQLVENLDNKI